MAKMEGNDGDLGVLGPTADTFLPAANISDGIVTIDFNKSSRKPSIRCPDFAALKADQRM